MDPKFEKVWREQIAEHAGKKDTYNENQYGRLESDLSFAKDRWNWANQMNRLVFHRPVEWIHEQILKVRRPPEAYYHKRYPRVPTADTCYLDDLACRYEAAEQYKRDRLVDAEIIEILNNRVSDCFHWHGGYNGEEGLSYCRVAQNEATQAEINFKVKYGHSQIGPANAARAFLRQRIRMIREELYFMWLRDHPDKIPIPKDNLEPHTSWRAD